MNEEANELIKLDLFKLHDNRDKPRAWIVAKGCGLKDELGNIIKKIGISNTQLVKYLMKKLNISIASAERLVYLQREWYPLIFISEIVDLSGSSKYEIQDKIEYIKSSSPPVVEYKAVKELMINLCKIAGAHLADGTLNDSFIAITDRYKDTIYSLISWFVDFNYKPKLIRIGENEYGVKFHSRIISRYLTKIFEFPSGCKQYTAKVPLIIMNAPIEFKKAFLVGALTFEAGISIGHEVQFCVVSKEFRDNVSCLLSELGIAHVVGYSAYWRFWSNKLTDEEAKNWLDLFEPNTEKWFKLRDYISGFGRNVCSFNEALNILDSVYPKLSQNKVGLIDILLLFKELKQTYRYELVDYLVKKNNLDSYGSKWAHSLKPYLDILKRANIISVGKAAFGKKVSFGTIVREVYIFNENFKEWKLPERMTIK